MFPARKGQEEAPIELLIGVTILTFVLIVGFYTYNNLCGQQYEQKVRSSLSNLARNLELVYQSSGSTSLNVRVDFSAVGSCSGKVEKIVLTSGLEETCLRQTGSNDCLLLVAATRASSAGQLEPTLASEAVKISRDTLVSYEPRQQTAVDCSTGQQDDLGSALCSWQPLEYNFQVSKTDKGIEIKQL